MLLCTCTEFVHNLLADAYRRPLGQKSRLKTRMHRSPTTHIVRSWMSGLVMMHGWALDVFLQVRRSVSAATARRGSPGGCDPTHYAPASIASGQSTFLIEALKF